MGAWKIEGKEFENGKVTAVYLSNEFFGLDYARFEPARPHGKWIYHPERKLDGECPYECSRCGMGSDVDYDFCMKCGADNREVEK